MAGRADKLLVTTLSLHFRKSHPDLFLKGTYAPLTVVGEMADHVVAFAREWGSDRVIVLAPRLLAGLGTVRWDSTRVKMRPRGKPHLSSYFHGRNRTSERVGSSTL